MCDPGRRVIGLFDLQVLPRRITLDFNDIFSKGFAFATIVGEFEFRSGLAHTDHVIIQALSSTY
ncbi:MAG: AsmA-like C-terminal region-containing protein [Thiotrichaceae bacterium]